MIIDKNWKMHFESQLHWYIYQRFIIHILSLIVIFVTVKQYFGCLEINEVTIQCQICQGYSLSLYKRCRKVNIVYCKLERTYWGVSKQEETQFYISSKVFARRLNSIIMNRNKTNSKGKNLISIYLKYTYKFSNIRTLYFWNQCCQYYII